MFSINSPVAAALSKELDFCALRHQIYSANVANADAKGYQRLEVVRLQRVSAMESPATTAPAGQVVTTSNAVKLDQEMAKLASNAMRYETLLTAYEKTAGILKLAVKEGRGS